MPFAAKRPCSFVGCRALASGRYCEEHQAQAGVPAAPAHRWDTERRAVPRIRGRELQRRRRALFAREPLCRVCAAEGRVVAATVRDHIVPLAEGGADDDTNVQPLCGDCSDAKTREESKRGRAREAPAR